jgi:NAD(P)-dependent dehydrogenase (short-subunit alcohol dehydrogenase family)
MAGRFEGAVALVTGAARLRGIGRATVLRLAAEGADIAVCGLDRIPDPIPDEERDLNWRGIHSVAEEVQAMGRRAIALHCDVSRAADVDAAFEAATAALGTPTAIVNNAGVVATGAAPIVTLEESAWRRMLDINLTGVFLVSKSGASRMLQAGLRGAIVNVASIAGRMPYANFGAYCASKFGVLGFTQQMALELAPHGIRVNALCPGGTDTDMMTNSFRGVARESGATLAELTAGAAGRIPLGRLSSPDEQAAAIAFLLSGEASFITGQALNANGGARMD